MDLKNFKMIDLKFVDLLGNMHHITMPVENFKGKVGVDGSSLPGFTKTEATATEQPKPRKPRGFAAMDRTKVSEIASKGGRAAHEKGTAHEWTADEARNAGRKGGQVSRGGRGRLVVPPDSAMTPGSTIEGPSDEKLTADRAE